MLSGEDAMEDQHVKLIDFGLSNSYEFGTEQNTFCGTPAYTAPEMVYFLSFPFALFSVLISLSRSLQILAVKYSGPEVDVWSLGVVLHLMLVGNFPFANVSAIISGTFVPQLWFPPV